MGYRSDAALVLKTSDYENIIKTIKDSGKYSVAYSMVVDESLEPINVELKCDEYVVLKWERCKWYDIFPEIDFINEIKKRYNSLFMRCGDDVTDNEMRLNGNDYGMFGRVTMCRDIIVH